MSCKSYKVVIVGECAVGKTSFLCRFAGKTYPFGSNTTIGVDYQKVQLSINETESVELCIWDTAGLEKFRSFISRFYHGAHGIILMFDVNVKHTFEALNWWVEDIKENNENASIVLVGNKSEDDMHPAVSKEEMWDFAVKKGLTFFLASAKTNMNVDEVFRVLAEAMCANAKTHVVDNTRRSLILRKNDSNVHHSSCCYGVV